MNINALCIAGGDIASAHCDKLVLCGQSYVRSNGKCVVERILEYDSSVRSGDIYIPSISDEGSADLAFDYMLSTGSRAIVRAAYDLEESGVIEARYKLSPIMLLHKIGVLDKCTIAGGVCLDNDDLDLMAQEGTPLILLPTIDAGYGHGFAPVCAAIRRGVRVGIGTFDGKYNRTHDLKYETEFLKLTANAEMRTENALSLEDIEKILGFA